VVAEVKALACALPQELGVPLSRLSRADIRQLAIERGIVAEISGATIWRWLAADAIRPWQHRSWIFPRDPDFAAKAGVVLDLYERRFEGEPLGPDEHVICADEKTSIQARKRIHPSAPAGPGRSMRVEHEYERMGALAYLAAWDVQQARIFGRLEPRSGIAPFDRLVEQVMLEPPYCCASRVFWIVDNGSSHRGQRSIDRLAERWPNLCLVHLPVHASWLNQIEIYFSILQRKLLTPNHFADLAALEDAILAFERRYQQIATPFDWKFTRADLHRLLARVAAEPPTPALLAA
jgi:DDE superfamily endonuclease